MTSTEQDLRMRACRLRFWEHFNETAKKAGGGNASALLAMPFGEVVKHLAHNGFVFTYDQGNHMDYVHPSYVIQAAVGRINEIEGKLADLKKHDDVLTSNVRELNRRLGEIRDLLHGDPSPEAVDAARAIAHTIP